GGRPEVVEAEVVPHDARERGGLRVGPVNASVLFAVVDAWLERRPRRGAERVDLASGGRGLQHQFGNGPASGQHCHPQLVVLNPPGLAVVKCCSGLSEDGRRQQEQTSDTVPFHEVFLQRTRPPAERVSRRPCCRRYSRCASASATAKRWLSGE